MLAGHRRSPPEPTRTARSTLADGTITYVPDTGFAGPATFTYTVCDDGTTNAAPDPLCNTGGAVTIQVVGADQPPVADGQTVTRRRGPLARRRPHRIGP